MLWLRCWSCVECCGFEVEGIGVLLWCSSLMVDVLGLRMIRLGSGFGRVLVLLVVIGCGGSLVMFCFRLFVGILSLCCSSVVFSLHLGVRMMLGFSLKLGSDSFVRSSTRHDTVWSERCMGSASVRFVSVQIVCIPLSILQSRCERDAQKGCKI